MNRRLSAGNERFATCKCTIDDFKRTIPDLAMTPQQVKSLADRGIPVSTTGMQQIYDANDDSWRIEPMLKRGADICQLWEMEKSAQRRVLNARRKDATMFR